MDDFVFDFDLNKVAPEGAGSALPPDESEEENRLGYPYVKFLQGNTTLDGFDKGMGAGMIAIGKSVPQESGSKRFEGYLFERFYFLPIDKLTDNTAGSNRKGGRGLWGFSPTDGKSDYVEGGEKKAMLCKSTDGMAPHNSYLGKTVKLPLTHDKFPGGTVIIGASTVIPAGATGDINIQISTPTNVCAQCPLGGWYKDTSTGRPKQLCTQRFVFPVYVPKQPALQPTGNKKNPFQDAEWPGGIVLLQGGSRSSQMALTSGDGKRSPAKNTDGRELIGFFNLISRHQYGVTRRILKSELTAEIIQTTKDGQLPAVRGFAADLESDAYLGAGAELNDLARRPEMQYAVVEYPSYKYAMSGLPQQVGVDEALPGMRYLVAAVTKVDVMNAPYGPDLAVSAEMVSEEEALLWEAALESYAALDARKLLLGTEANMPVVQEKLTLAAGQGWQMLTAGREDAPQLGAAEEVVDASELQDM